jgi:hypothetical protein
MLPINTAYSFSTSVGRDQEGLLSYRMEESNDAGGIQPGGRVVEAEDPGRCRLRAVPGLDQFCLGVFGGKVLLFSKEEETGTKR